MIFRITAAIAATVSLAALGSPPHKSPVREVTVTAEDFKFDAPESLPAGVVRFNLVNKGTQLHHVTIVRLNAGHTLKDLTDALSKKGPPPSWMEPVGGPNAVGPNGTANATLALQPGTYALMCFVDGGPSDPVPHFAKGMIRELKVTKGKAARSALGKADMTVTLKDYAFVTPRDFTAGKHTLRIENAGPQEHEVEIVRLAPGKTVQDLMGWLQTMQGPPPGEALGGAASLAVGKANLVDVDFTPGNYVFLCFVPDMKDGAPHFVHGMVRAFTIN